MRQRLDHALVEQKLVPTRSQAESWIKMGEVTVDGVTVTKPGHFVTLDSKIKLLVKEQYVSRAGLKLASVAEVFKIKFIGSTVLDVGSSTGGFTEYALRHGAVKVYAVDVGTEQLHPSLRGDKRIELHEKTDIRNFVPATVPTIVVMDVSFISVRQILPYVATIISADTDLYIMVKPQFEAGRQQLTSGGIVKNDSVRRTVLKEFEQWVKGQYLVLAKADSDVRGAHGNLERFYHLRKTKNSR